MLQLVKGQHVYDIGCNVDHIMRVAYYSLYQLCSCPIRTIYATKFEMINATRLTIKKEGAFSLVDT